MRNFLVLSIFTVFLSYNLFAQGIAPEEINKFVFGKLIVKLKPEVKVSPAINNEINSKTNHSGFGINSIDGVLNEYSIQDIDQKFPHHNNAEFQSQMRRNMNTPVNTLENIYELNFDESIPVSFLINKLRRLPEVEYAEPVYIYEEHDVPNDTDYSVLQHLPQIMAEEGWDIAKGEDGAEVVIGICDSGVEWNHPDLIGNLKQNLGEDADGDGSVIQFNEETQQWEFDPDDINGIDDDGNGYPDDFIGWNFSFYTDNTPMNQPGVSLANAHGTHVAGLAAGVTNNEEGISAISWNVKFLPTKHGSNDGSPQIFSPYEGIVYLAENGADIINMSWGGGPFSNFDKDVIDYAVSLGSILVASAGNGNTIAPAFPASYSGVISVASVASSDAKAYYSHFGPNVDISSPGGDRNVDGGLLSTIPGFDYAKFQGTSMAAPVAAGLFALVKSYFPEKTNDEIIAQILGTADDISTVNAGFDNLLGTGRINALKALTQAPVLEEGLKLSVLNTGFYIYDEETDDYFLSGIAKPNTEGKMQLVVKNSNNFYGVNQLNVSVTSDNPDFVVENQTAASSIGPDETIFMEVPFTVVENAETGYVNFDITFSTPDGEILYGSNATYQAFLNAGGVLVWEPVQSGQDMSGMFFKEYYENMGVEVYYTNEVLPSFEGFDAVFCSYGSVSAPNFFSYAGAIFNTMINSLNYNFLAPGTAKIFIESQNIISHFGGIYGLPINPMWIGAGGYEYDPEETTAVEDITGVESNEMFSEFLFESSSQENSYEMDRFLIGPTSSPMFDIPEFGNVVHYGINMFGSSVILSSVSISKLDDEACPSTRENFMRRMNTLFGIYGDLEIDLSDVETCRGATVSIGGNAIECDDDYPIIDYISGGSGYYDLQWSPAHRLDDATSSNPSYGPVYYSYTGFTLNVTDYVTGESISKNIAVTTLPVPSITTPLLKILSANDFDINCKDVTGWAQGTSDYNWYDDSFEALSEECVDFSSTGIHRISVEGINEQGCVSRMKRIIVFTMNNKQTIAEDDVAVSADGVAFMYANPSPVINEFNLFADFEKAAYLEMSISDMAGRELMRMVESSSKTIDRRIDISEYKSGVYFVTVTNGISTVTKKIIKQ